MVSMQNKPLVLQPLCLEGKKAREVLQSSFDCNYKMRRENLEMELAEMIMLSCC